MRKPAAARIRAAARGGPGAAVSPVPPVPPGRTGARGDPFRPRRRGGHGGAARTGEIRRTGRGPGCGRPAAGDPDEAAGQGTGKEGGQRRG
ncbi:hypothetical protein GCM10027168_28300 [Streptomyces capparidis]